MQDSSAGAPPKKKSKAKLWVIIGCVIAAVAILTVLTVLVFLPMIKYDQGVTALREKQYEKGYALLESLGDYKDAPKQIQKAKMAQSLAFLKDGKHEEAFKLIEKIDMTTDFRGKLYKAGIAAIEEEYYDSAVKVFSFLEDYKLSENYYIQSLAQYYNKLLAHCSVGDVIGFGAIDQDNNEDNGKEPINWIVLNKSTGGIQMVSESVLFRQQYSSISGTAAWTASTLKIHLNTEFLADSFSDEYKAMLSAGINPDGEIVSVMTAGEVDELLADDHVVADLTKAAKKTDGSAGWWLKDGDEEGIYYVDDKGEIQKDGKVDEYRGVRPVISLLPTIPVVYADPEIKVPTADVPVTEMETPMQSEEEEEEAPVVNDPVSVPEPEPEYDTSSVYVGDYITMGTYEQDNNTANGDEPIQWEVIAVENGKALVISRYALECLPYNDVDESVTWEQCSLRSWLNSTFYNNAFSAYERDQIVGTTLSNEDNSEYATPGGNGTFDNVFLLSIAEVQRYIPLASDRLCLATDYAASKGVWIDDENGDTCWWWLRSPGTTTDHAAGVRTIGAVGTYGNGVTFDDDGVRPAMWITVE